MGDKLPLASVLFSSIALAAILLGYCTSLQSVGMVSTTLLGDIKHAILSTCPSVS
jgi:hypothetical protein